MQLKVFQDYHEMSAAAAASIIDCVRKKPNALLCFATGDTPKLTYNLLLERAKKESVDFSKCFFIGLDEWLGIPPDNTGSCHYFLHHYLFHPLAVDPSQVHLFNGMSKNEAAECERMNTIINEKGPVDFMLVGVGMNGHVGFNEPGTEIDSTAHVAKLDQITTTVGKKYFENDVSISKGITLGLKQVMQAKFFLMIANGKKKAPVIKEALEKPVSTSFPASLIRSHQNGLLLIDTEAASDLQTLKT
jgi:glucosamine-6-phosphate isomerase